MVVVGGGEVVTFAAFALVGVVFLVVTTTNVVVGRRLPDTNRVSIFSILQSGVFLGLSLGALLGGVVSMVATSTCKNCPSYSNRENT